VFAVQSPRFVHLFGADGATLWFGGFVDAYCPCFGILLFLLDCVIAKFVKAIIIIMVLTCMVLFSKNPMGNETIFRTGFRVLFSTKRSRNLNQVRVLRVGLAAIAVRSLDHIFSAVDALQYC
jgi:hypothetical protein